VVGWLRKPTRAKWTIAKDDTAPSKPNVLKQSGEATYPVALKNDTSLKDGFVEVKFKAFSAEEDQAGSVIWRAKDADNYYIARAKTAKGRAVRSSIPLATEFVLLSASARARGVAIQRRPGLPLF